MSQTITVPTETRNNQTYNGFTATQNYVYDSLNRLFQASETIAPNISNWTQTFSYDRYGNRTFNEQYTTTLPKNCLDGSTPVVCASDRNRVNPSASTTNNRLVGYTFDDAGNTTVDAEGRTFTYDAENKQTKVVNAQSQTIGEYAYDGDGKRVKKVVGNETTIFVYDAAGKLVAEYANQTATTPQVSYLTADHLGSPRINTDADGRVTARHDYQPFGEEIQRASYGADTVKQKFTSYERDDETNLDYAKARMLGSSLGRFTSSDPYNIILESKAEPDTDKARAKLVSYLGKPQQWNRYAYVMNNPLIYIDPSGETLELTGTRKERDKTFDRILDLCGEKCSGRLYLEETKDGRTFVRYFDNKGGLSGNAGEIGQVLEDIINSDTNVEVQVTSKTTVTWADGDTENITTGGKTRHISSSRTQVFIYESVSMSTISDSQWVLGVKATDGTKLVNTESTVLAHELGHAWGAIKDNFYASYAKTYKIQQWQRYNLISENNKRAVQVENMQRSRLGLTHRDGH